MSYLDRIVISAPCPVSWESMEGNERVRHCTGCARSVYNLSDMSTQEAEAFLEENGTSQCVKLFRRQDGKITTDNCPLGLRAIRNKARNVYRFVAGFLAQLFAISTACAQTADERANYAGGLSVAPPKPVNTRKTTLLGADDCSAKVSKVTELEHSHADNLGDKRVLRLYKRGLEAEMKNQFLVAQVLYKQALKVSQEVPGSDPMFLTMIRTQLTGLEFKIKTGSVLDASTSKNDSRKTKDTAEVKPVLAD